MQALLDRRRGSRESIARVDEMADFEKHQEGGEENGQSLGDAHRRVLAAVAAHQSCGIAKGQGRRAIAIEQPVENRRRAGLGDDARFPGEPCGDDHAEPGDAPAQCRNLKLHADIGSTQRGRRQSDDKRAAFEREGEAERQRGDGGRSENAGGEAGIWRFVHTTFEVAEFRGGTDEDQRQRRRTGGKREATRAFGDAHPGDDQHGERRQRRRRAVDRQRHHRQAPRDQHAPAAEREKAQGRDDTKPDEEVGLDRADEEISGEIGQGGAGIRQDGGRPQTRGRDRQEAGGSENGGRRRDEEARRRQNRDGECGEQHPTIAELSGETAFHQSADGEQAEHHRRRHGDEVGAGVFLAGRA